MPAPADAIMPVLKRIQAEITDTRKDIKRVDRKVDTAIVEVKGVSERMGAFEDYFTYTMGLTEQDKADIRRLGERKAEAASQA